MRLFLTTLLLLAAGTASLPSVYPAVPIPPGPVHIDPLPPSPHPPLGLFWPVDQPPLPSLTASAPSFAVTLGACAGYDKRDGDAYGGGGESGGDPNHSGGGDQGGDKNHGDHGHCNDNNSNAHGNGHGPTVRSYNFTITYAAGDPDGFLRRLTTINGLFPGPTIEAFEGEMIEIHVTNAIDTPQSIHWHGLEQRGTNYMDGVPGFTQCPIRPGATFTYRFTADSAGTYFYHSHYGNTMSDGLYGGLVIHSRDAPLRLGRDYDADYILWASDWYDTQSETIISGISDVHAGYRGVPVVAMPDAIIVNGVGQVDCTTTQQGVPCVQKTPYELALPAGSRVRLRIINPGGHAMVRVSIDSHVLQVIEADSTPIKPFATHEVPVNNGQRYSVIATLDQGQDTAAIIRVNAATYCQNPSVAFAGFGVLRYTDAAGKASTAVPVHRPWPDLAEPHTTPCTDFDDALLVPSLPEDAPAETVTAAQLDSHSGVFLDPQTGAPYLSLAFNNTPYLNYINSPFFSELAAGRALNASNIPSVTFNNDGTADLIINLLDPQPLAHPFHLHGRPFYLIARGNGSLTTADIPALTNINLHNPIRRDTLTITPGTWALLRIKLDDPGVWALHCHIGWHLAVGKMAAVTIRQHEFSKQVPPAEWNALCAGTDINEIGPRASPFNERVPPQARRSLATIDTRDAVAEWRLRSERIKRWFEHVAPPQDRLAERQAQWKRWVENAVAEARAGAAVA
ncbi:Laccase-2 [Vanrija pseudolonga]|uniref:Laccase-2 n=1 Tax=Vanrija pseudolonga TaxID=143232 RepID=A0AAF0YFI8_9TREE|nr:Laccase-2 [Vanrija pseudolonga]